MAGAEVRLELKAVEIHGHRAIERAGEDSVRFGQTLELARGHFISLDDGARFEDGLKRREDLRLAQIHAQRGRLHHEHVVVFVHDKAAGGSRPRR